MKRHVLFALIAMLCTFIPRNKCKDIYGSKNERAGFRLAEPQRDILPVRMRLGEVYFIRLNDPMQSRRALELSSLPRVTTVNHALQLKLTKRLIQEELRNVLTDRFIQVLDSAERKRRGDEPPISLDLTFHLLRDVLEMTQAEHLAQQASNNRKIMDLVGK